MHRASADGASQLTDRGRRCCRAQQSRPTAASRRGECRPQQLLHTRAAGSCSLALKGAWLADRDR